MTEHAGRQLRAVPALPLRRLVLLPRRWTTDEQRVHRRQRRRAADRGQLMRRAATLAGCRGGARRRVRARRGPAAPLDFPNATTAPAARPTCSGGGWPGVAAPYSPNPTLAEEEARLRADMRYRRQVAWQTVHQVLEPVPLLGLADRPTRHGETSSSPTARSRRCRGSRPGTASTTSRRMFQTLYEELGAERARGAARRSRDEDIDAAFARERAGARPLQPLAARALPALREQARRVPRRA